jgi:DNA-binding ferritin-like protein
VTNESAAAHLAEIDARYEAHAAALEQHAEIASDAVDEAASELAERIEPKPDTP